MDRFALIVHACDRYQLLYKGFEYFFQKYFPYQEVSVSYYFFTEEADCRSEIFTTIKTGKGEWSDRLKNGLQQIPETYIIYLQEDMWLTIPLNAETVNLLIDFVRNKQANLFKLSSNSVYKTNPTGEQINGLAVTTLDNRESGYLMSHQISIWNRSFLLAQLNYQEHPWRNEREGTKRLKKLNPVIYHADLLSENDHSPINKNGDEVVIGRYYTVSQNAQLNSYALPLIEEMKNDNSGQLKAYAETLQYHYDHALTHDGKSKPRKEDLFKRLKNAFKKAFTA